MVFHLGMSGRWRIDPETIGLHDHLLLETDSARRIVLNDPRRFGSVDLVCTDEIHEFGPFVELGPEPLGDEFTTGYLREALMGRAAPIKTALLDQHVIAGLGNIYVCEALHLSRISPGRAAGSISPKRLERLVEAIRTVLLAAIEAGGSTLRDYARPDGELGYFSKQWRVYGREGETCSCGSLVRRRVEAGRSTFFCSRCQR